MEIDLTTLDVDLGKLLTPSVQVDAPSTSPPPAMADSLQKLQELLTGFQASGVLTQRTDGSYVIAGHTDPRQVLIDERGSACHCPRCTMHNQWHWVCCACFSTFEWHVRGPHKEVVMLGEAGRSGKRFAACTPDCAVRMQTRFGQQTVMPLGIAGGAELQGIQIAGGDDGYGALTRM